MTQLRTLPTDVLGLLRPRHDLPALPLRELAELCESTPPFEVEMLLEDTCARSRFDPFRDDDARTPYIRRCEIVPVLRSPVLGRLPFEALPQSLRSAMEVILRARPDWRWTFRLAPERGIVVSAFYTCQCAAREELRATANFALAGVGREEYVVPFCENFYRAHERNIEAHTATWSRFRIPEEAAYGDEPARCSRCSKPLQLARDHSRDLRAVCADLRAYPSLPVDVWRRTPGVLPPGLPTTPQQLFCLGCGDELRRQH